MDIICDFVSCCIITVMGFIFKQKMTALQSMDLLILLPQFSKMTSNILISCTASDFSCCSLSIRMRFYNTEVFRSLTSGKTQCLLCNYMMAVRNTCSVISLINRSCLD